MRGEATPGVCWIRMVISLRCTLRRRRFLDKANEMYTDQAKKGHSHLTLLGRSTPAQCIPALGWRWPVTETNKARIPSSDCPQLAPMPGSTKNPTHPRRVGDTDNVEKSNARWFQYFHRIVPIPEFRTRLVHRSVIGPPWSLSQIGFERPLA